MEGESDSGSYVHTCTKTGKPSPKPNSKDVIGKKKLSKASIQ